MRVRSGLAIATCTCTVHYSIHAYYEQIKLSNGSFSHSWSHIIDLQRAINYVMSIY